MLAKAIDTVIITPEGKIIRRGLEDLSAHPINYIRGRTDLVAIAPKYSSKILQLVNQATDKDSEAVAETPKEEVKAEEPTANSDAPVTTPDEPETTTDAKEASNSTETPATTSDEGSAQEDKAEDKEEVVTSEEKPSDSNWINPQSVKASVTLLAKRKNGPTIYYDKAGNAVGYNKVTVDNVNDLFVDKEGKQPLVDVMKSIKDKMAKRKAQIVKQAAIFGESYDDSMEYEDFITEDVFDDYTDDLITQEEEIVEEPIVEDLDNNDCDITTITYNDIVSGLVDNVDDNMMDSMIEELNTLASVYGIRPEELVIVVDEYDDLNPAFLSKVTRIGNLSRYINKYRCGDQEFYADTRTPAYIYFKSMDDANSYCANCVEENI
jgi:hypothetical protein